MEQYQPLINHCAREGLYHNIHSLCAEALKKRGDDPVLLFWKSVAPVLECPTSGGSSEAMRELQTIQEKREVKLAVLAGMAFAHSKAKLVDAEAVEELQKQFAAETPKASFDSLVLAATFFLHTKQVDKARELARKAQEKQDSASVKVLQGWVDFAGGPRDSAAPKASRSFDPALKMTAPKFSAEALVGQAKCAAAQKKYAESLELLNQAAVLHPWFAVPATCEKARVLMASGEWDQAVEAASKALAKEPQSIEALEVAIVHSLAREGTYSVVSAKIGELTKALDAREPRNTSLYCRLSRVIASLAGKNALVLKSSQALIDRALAVSPDDSSLLTEAGRQALLLGNSSVALSQFKLAIKNNESNIEALNGVVRALIQSGNLVEAEQQLDFLNELHSSIGKTPELLFLTGLVRSMARGAEEGQVAALQREAVDLFTQAVEMHFKSMKSLPLSGEYFVQFNADMLLDIARQYLATCPDEPLDAAAPIPEALVRARKLLEIVSKAIPGHIECLFLLSLSRFLANDIDKAVSAVAQCIRLNPAYSEAHLMLAQLQIAGDQPRQALHSLDNAVSHNFKVRHNAEYFLLKAKAHSAIGDHEQAWKALDQAFELPAVKGASGAGDRWSRTSAAADPEGGFVPSQSVLASLHIERAQSLVSQGKAAEGRELLADSARQFKGTPQEIRVVIAQAQVLIKVGDTQSALRLLSVIDSKTPAAFIKAQAVMASIYLSQQGDKRGYVRCYERLNEVAPSLHTTLLLADSYMKIQEPEKAIELYRKALSQTPGEQTVQKRIGLALLSTHEFGKAIEYYESAAKADPANLALAYDLAELHSKMKRVADAERVIKGVIDRSKELTSIGDLALLTKFYVLLAKIQESLKTVERVGDVLLKAREAQATVIARAKAEQPDMLAAAKQAAAAIAFQLAEHFLARAGVPGLAEAGQQQFQQRAQAFYLETLQHDDQHKKAMLALATLYLARGEFDLCQHQAITMLRMDPGNEDASMLLANLMSRKGDWDAAVFHFGQLLQKKPDHYVGLSRLLELLRCAGKVPDAERFIAVAEAKPAHTNRSGLFYCRGLYHRYTGNLREALVNFNVARGDPEWGASAREHMIRIYLGEDTQLFMDEDEDDGKGKDKDKGKDRGGSAGTSAGAAEDMTVTVNVNSAKELLRELTGGKPAEELKHKIFEEYTLIMTKQKQSVEQAIAALTPLCAGEDPDPSALLALSVAHMALRQSPKARNQLRRLVKMDWRIDRASEFERGWLLLSHIYIEGSKYDLAQELLKQALARNKSCAKAWELLGYIMEKEQSYRDAAENYENAWKMCGESDPAVGFKLAFNYLKAKRYVEAILICNKVLAVSPSYPKIKKDILDRARQSLRP